MNRHLLKSAVLLLVLLGGRAQAQQKPAGDTLRNSLQQLMASANPGDQAVLKQRLYQLLATNDEDKWTTASNFFYMLKEKEVSDSIVAADKKKFPEGKLVRNDAIQPIYDEKDPVKKEALLKEWMKRFPPEKMGDDRIMYDYARNAVAMAYADADNVAKTVEYANSIETAVWKGQGWAGSAGILAKKGHKQEAAVLYKKAIDDAYNYVIMEHPDNGAQFAAMGYSGYLTSYASLLYSDKQYDSALVYVEKAYAKKKSYEVTELYVNVLSALNKNEQAMGLLEKLVKQGLASAQAEEKLKQLYGKVHGSDAGYAEYKAGLDKEMVAFLQEKASKEMVNLPSSDFVLRDLDGKEVSLASLKGKVVILDFWATWCGPCKRSFPAMQMAVNKYKADADVQFLFIDTWEHVDDASASVSSFIKGNKYSFEVLLDPKDPKSGVCKAVSGYGVNGIPAKFVIDKQGRIRFKLTGFEGSNEGAVAELSAMIELARKG